MENWENVMRTKSAAKAEIARGILEQSGINAVLMDRKDNYSGYFGYVDVMVPLENVEAAKALLVDEIETE